MPSHHRRRFLKDSATALAGLSAGMAAGPQARARGPGGKMVEAARRYKRVVQVGTQNRSAPYVRKALEYIRSGALGTVHLCKVYNVKSGSPYRQPPAGPLPAGVDYDRWLGPAPQRPFH